MPPLPLSLDQLTSGQGCLLCDMSHTIVLPLSSLVHAQVESPGHEQ